LDPTTDVRSSEDRIKYTSLDLFDEDRNQAVNANGHVIKGREDGFKGLTSSAVKKIYQENDSIVKEKQEISLRTLQEERNYADQQVLIQSHMNQSFEEELIARRQIRLEQAVFLQQQAKEQAHRHILQEKDKFGKIEGGYYSNFGKSCR